MVINHVGADRQTFGQQDAESQLGLRDVPFSGVVIQHVHIISQEERVGVAHFDPVAHAAHRGDADADSQRTGYRECKCDVPYVERIVAGFGCRGFRVGVVAFDPDVEQKGLPSEQTVRRWVDIIDLHRVAVPYADASHRPHVGGSLCREIAQSVESIGREGIQAAALRLRGDRQRQPYRESRSDDDLLAILHYIQEFGSGRKPPGRKLQISYFLVFWQKNRSLRR